MKQPKVFIVDDDKVFSKLLVHQAAEAVNAKTFIFESGEQCLENLYLKPDFVLLDFHTQNLDGLDTFLKIREACPKADAIVISDGIHLDAVMETIEAGAHVCLGKNPVVFSSLQEYLKRLWKAKEKENANLYLEFKVRKDVAFITGGFLIALLLIWFISGVL